ncbi:hypothetical protein MTP99_017035 [Tenebrio molitor]|nr:hypothetical protein MTP99_017035 [Tenebrio molitor]
MFEANVLHRSCSSSPLGPPPAGNGHRSFHDGSEKWRTVDAVRRRVGRFGRLRFSSDHGEDTISVEFPDVFSRNADVFTMHCTFSQTLERDGSMRGVAWQTRMRRVAAVKLG